MKIAFLLSMVALLLFGCDPDVANEGVTLPSIEFAFKVSPDTAYINVNDTVIFESVVSSTLSNGVKLNDGKVEVKAYISRSDSIPKVSTNDIEEIYAGDQYNLFVDAGGINFNDFVPGLLLGFTATPENDSLKMKYRFVFLKRGLYILQLYASFYKGSAGKTRASGYFDVIDPHWNLVQIPGTPGLTPGEEGYRKSYLIGVVD
jgi:hypothetical protein